MIRVENLSKNYGPFKAVDDLNFQVSKGEIFGFLGPNGVGKTTTINMLTGILQPSNGSVYLDDINLRTNPIAAKHIFGYVPDNPVMYEKLTLREFLDFVIDIYRLDTDKAWQQGQEFLEMFDLHERRNDLIASFSRGMKQKASLVSALLHEPKILFLDEPTNGLDPKSVRILKDFLLNKTKEGMTVVMSTHILEIAEKMSHRIGIINEGKLAALTLQGAVR